MTNTVLITGASRGIGLEFARQYAADGWRVHACCRNPDNATALDGHDCVVHALDVADRQSVEALQAGLGDEVVSGSDHALERVPAPPLAG